MHPCAVNYAVMQTAFDNHGRIKCGTIVTPDFEASLADWCETLGHSIAERGPLAEELVQSWSAPALAGRESALLRPPSGVDSFIRLIDGEGHPDYRPARSYGWAAYEITVADVFALRERLNGSGFTVIGEPKLVEGFTNFIPMQAVGRAGEIVYLNQVLESMSDVDLPLAQGVVDHMFIAVLAASDRAASVRFQTEALHLTEGGTYDVPYNVINQAFDLPDSTITAITMTQLGRLPVSEVDQYPGGTIPRPTPEGSLPPGNAMISFAVDSLDRVRAPFLTPPAARPGPLYDGRRSAVILGPDGERFELIDLAR